MLYSKSAQYAIQALIALAIKETGPPQIISGIAEEYNIPNRFLSKIVQTLANFGLVKTYRGRHGGIELGRPAKDIKVNEIVEVIDEPLSRTEMCVVGFDKCDDDAICPFHTSWVKIREEIQLVLEGENLEDLAKKVIEKQQLQSKK